MPKYRIKEGHDKESICTSAPEYRNGNGRFDLSNCTQRDLKYLFEVARHPLVEFVNDEKKTKQTEE